MEVIWWYALFAVTTAVMAQMELLSPVLAELRKDVSVYQYSVITRITFFCMSLLAAPVIIVPCLSKDMGDSFRATLKKAFEEA